MTSRLKYCGWGFEGDGLSAAEEDRLLAGYAARFEVDGFERRPLPKPEDIALRAPRVEVPAGLRRVCSTAHYDRLTHTYGQSYPDYLRTFRGDFANAPDVVAWAGTEEDVAAVLEWASGAKVAVIPYGGGSSVVGGVEAKVGEGYTGAVSLDLTGLDRVLEVDRASRAARFQGGIRGPAIEAGLRDHGLTLRHFPQSFEMATLGGMIATRSGGHFATLYTHIDDFVESLRCLTPSGPVESRRLPGSGAGPSPDRLMIGSEGALGVVTEAWMRLQDRPTFRASTAVLYPDFAQAVEAVRAVSQAGLYPSNLRVLDAMEAALNGVGDGAHAVLVLAFESADHPVDAWMARGLEICADHGGAVEGAAGEGQGHKAGSAGAWRSAFIAMPHYRAPLVSAGVIHDTFETAITWDRFAALHAAIVAETHAALRAATGRPGLVSCRFTHLYPDGPAPYYSFVGLGRQDALLEQWQEIKQRASNAVMDAGGTITHHHAVGRDHMPWYERQRPALFGDGLSRVKAALDPAGILNPGVLLSEPRP